MASDDAPTKGITDKVKTSSSSAFLWFNIITMVYFVMVYFSKRKRGQSGAGSDGGEDGNVTLIYSVSYYIVIGILMFSNNAIATQQACGEANFYTTLLSTLVPWTMIFGLVSVMLLIFPGWKAPFSNTFGYAVAMIGGIDGVAGQLFKSSYLADVDSITAGKIPAKTKLATEAINHVYQDPTLIINEVTPGRFDNFWDLMRAGDLIHTNWAETDDGPCPNLEACKERLYSLIVMKDVVAEAIWYWLAGNLAISVTQNYILNSGCQASAATMAKREKEYEETVEGDNEHRRVPGHDTSREPRYYKVKQM
jgi:hypothetical protein